MRFLAFLLLSPVILLAQANEGPLIATLDSFMKISKERHAKYNLHKPGKKYNCTYAKVTLFIYNGSGENLELYKDLEAGIPFEILAQKYPGMEIYPDFFVFEPVFIDQYYNKILFHALPNPNRYRNLSFDNNKNLKRTGDFKKGTRLVDSTGGDLTGIQFSEPFSQHALPSFLNEGLNYYAAISGSADLLYTKLDKLNAEPPVFIQKLIANYEGFPGKPKEPAEGEENYKGRMEEYRKSRESFVQRRCEFLNDHYKSYPDEKKQISAFNKYFTSLSIDPGFHSAEEQECIGLPEPDYMLFTPSFYRYHRGRNSRVALKWLKDKNYTKFSKVINLLSIYNPHDSLNKKLKIADSLFYERPELACFGFLASALITNKGDVNYHLSCLYHLDKPEVDLKAIGLIKDWFKTKPQDLLFVYLAGQYWSDHLEDIEDDAEQEKSRQEFEEALKPFPGIKILIEEN